MTTKIRPSTLENTAVTAGTYGGASQMVVYTVDSQGRLTYAANVTPSISATQVANNQTYGINISGNSATVTNGVYSNGSYSDPSWITSLAKSKVGLGNVDNTADSSKSVSYASTAGRAYPYRSDGGNLNFYWSGQSGQPTWLWGGSDGTNMYVYNPSNFSVNYATTAGTASNISSYTINQSVGTGNSPTFANVYSGAFYYTSDRNLKTSIVPLADSGSIIAGLKPVSFQWIESGKSDCGFIAQEVQEVLPNSVSQREDGTLTVNDAAIVAHLVAVVQDLQKRIAELENK